jgi:SNF2-related domain/Helicase conserved C-terminal domain
MSSISPDLVVGQSVAHAEMGVGVFVGLAVEGYARVFFKGHGERQVPLTALTKERSWEEQVIANVQPATPEALLRLWLAVEAEQLPLLENSASLTAAKVDLLPHQIVLTYRIANASPRRFLIADSVGLGKTIETALVLRELASRGELTRALMVVPAGLVENWRRELNDTFHLDFEVFGSEGDVTDRKSNAFAKHNRLIASIDTLKRPARVKRLMEAPLWDLIVFDEAHHLTAYRSGNRVTRTQNFRLAEELRNHSRDLLLLSATPHQGDHFRFWMLIRLLNPSLFESADDMLDNRHRLNAVVFRRTQADACDAHGSPLFARRQVHTQTFHLTDPERRFYDALMEYIREGYDLAETAGNKGRALGFVMTIFQKIAASSFAAVGATLRRRLLMLTIHEAIVCDENLDVDGRDRALNEARQLLREMFILSAGAIGRAETDRLLADARVQLLRKLGEDIPEDGADGESAAAGEEDMAAALVSVAIPAERRRIQELLAILPRKDESKTQELLRGLGDLWTVHPDEKIVIFTTYLGSVDTLRDAIQTRFQGVGVEVLKGGDHGAKLAAERRFRRPNGPRVLICTAAGREGINLQFARVLFNHDLPWNPMDVEQRIGRIHRYGQIYTAQVYNLVSGDTIEGKIFLLLEEKLREIGKTLGKVDERGQITEDLREQVLGQLSERLSYDKLYQDAVRDPTLRRSRQELDVALDNARTARQLVSELFQDLEGFRLDDYRQFDDGGMGVKRLLRFVQEGAQAASGTVICKDPTLYEVNLNGTQFRFTPDRDRAKEDDNLTLLGIEHPLARLLIQRQREFPAAQRCLVGKVLSEKEIHGALSIWHVQIQGGKGQYHQRIVTIGINDRMERSRQIERLVEKLRDLAPAHDGLFESGHRTDMVCSIVPGMVRRDLSHNGLLANGASISNRLLAWVELV